MGTTNLTGPITRATGLVVALTSAGAVIAVLDPALVGSTPPHPALTGTIGDAASILAGNARTLAIPFAFIALGLGRSRPGRLVGDAGVLALVAVSTLNVGLAIGRWGAQLIPYIPQLPLEWAALALAADAWLIARLGEHRRGQFVAIAAAMVLLLCAAAALETWATPRRRHDQTAHARQVSTAGSQGQMSPAHFAGARPAIRTVSLDLQSLADDGRRP